MQIYLYSYVYIHANLPKCQNAIVRLSHSRSGDTQGQEMLLPPSADKQTRNYNTECSQTTIMKIVKKANIF